MSAFARSISLKNRLTSGRPARIILPMMSPASTARVRKLLALAASAALIGSAHEAKAALVAAARIAEAHGADLLPLADEANVDISCLVPWTEEEAPAVHFVSNLPIVTCDDGSMLRIYESDLGILIERFGDEALDYRLLSRGFWRDCEPAEAVLFAREAWGC